MLAINVFDPLHSKLLLLYACFAYHMRRELNSAFHGRYSSFFLNGFVTCESVKRYRWAVHGSQDEQAIAAHKTAMRRGRTVKEVARGNYFEV